MTGVQIGLNNVKDIKYLIIKDITVAWALHIRRPPANFPSNKYSYILSVNNGVHFIASSGDICSGIL